MPNLYFQNMYNNFSNSIFKIFIEIFILDKKRRAGVKAEHAKKYLAKYVDRAVLSDCDPLGGGEKNHADTIWQYWHQGGENAPLLIKKCFESVKKFEPDKEQIILSFETIKDYIEIPQRYYNLLSEKKIPIAIFSDILRVYLLNKYGGTWVDSTIYLTGKIPDDIMNSKFCVLQKNPESDNHKNKMSCFFIHAKNYSQNLSAIRTALDGYWEENNFLVNYFMFEHISTMLSDRTLPLKEEWEEMPYYDAEISGLLQKNLFGDYTPEGWQSFLSKTNIHKLSYKIIREKTSGKSYYDYIVNKQD